MYCMFSEQQFHLQAYVGRLARTRNELFFQTIILFQFLAYTYILITPPLYLSRYVLKLKAPGII